MHFDHSPDHPLVPRSKLGATLARLHRNLEGSRLREQAAFDLFEAWQGQWADHRELITRHLECLDRELADLSASNIPTPHLSLMAISDTPDEVSSRAFLSERDVAVRAFRTPSQK